MRRLFAFALASLLHAQSFHVSTVAGSDWVGDGGPATQALLFQAEGIAADARGNLYIADAQDHRVRKVVPDGTIVTVAGTGHAGFSGDNGPASEAELNAPYGLLADPQGNLYIADLGNARVRRVAPDGTITTVGGGGAIPAGDANDGTLATLLKLASPRNLALDNAGNVYISDFDRHRVYRLSREGSLTTVAGTGVAGYSGDGSSSLRAQLSYPTALAVDRQGTLYIADSQNHVVRKVVNGVISSVVHATTPTGLALDAGGTLYVADSSSGQILRVPAIGTAEPLRIPARDLAIGADGNLYVAAGGLVSRISERGTDSAAGGGNPAHGDGDRALLARVNNPTGVAVDGSGNIYIADRDNNRIRKVDPGGIISTIADNLTSPSSISLDAAGNLYIADTGNHQVEIITRGGSISRVASTPSPVNAIADGNGNVYIADSSGKILRSDLSGKLTTLLDGLQSPRGLALDHSGSLYFTDSGLSQVGRLDSTGIVTQIAAGAWSAPMGIVVTDSGDIYVADAGLGRVIHIDHTLITDASVGSPWAIATDSNGTLYIADPSSNRIRSLAPIASSSNPQAIDAVNAASMQPGPITPGMLVAIRGTNLQSMNITIAGIPSQIRLAEDKRVVVAAPNQLVPGDTVLIEIRDRDTLIATIPISVADAAPALFTVGPTQAAAVNQDGNMNSPDHPVPRGAWISLYGTGLGIEDLPVTVRIGDYPAEVLWAGNLPDSPGLFQINIRVPGGFLQPGILGAVVTVGPADSPAGVTIAVK